MPSIFGAVMDPQFRADVRQGLLDAANRGVIGGLLGGPVDLMTMAMRPLGYKVDKPVMGSEWIGQKMQDAGFVSPNRNPVAETLAGIALPAAAAKVAPKVFALEQAALRNASIAGPSSGPLGAQRGIFGGVGAQTADLKALERAQALLKKGDKPADVWRETGWAQGPDGKWRFEIDDSGAKFIDRFKQPSQADLSGYYDAKKTVDSIGAEKDAARAAGGFSVDGFYGAKPGLYEREQAAKRAVADYNAKYVQPAPKSGSLGEFLDHDAAEAAYPGVYDIATTHNKTHSGGSFNPGMNTMLVGGGNERSTALHELQHAIQEKERFASGGNLDMIDELVRQARKNELAPHYSGNAVVENANRNLGDVYFGQYLQKLDRLSTSPNIKPSQITNLSAYYEHSDKLREVFGPMPKKAGAERDRWLQDAAAFMRRQEINKSGIPEWKLEGLLSKNLDSEAKKLARQKDKYLPDSRAFQRVDQKFKEVDKLPDLEKYKRLGGEAEARLVQARADLTPAQRLEQFPYDPDYFLNATGVPIDGLLFR